jgi:hypothetical protein
VRQHLKHTQEQAAIAVRLCARLAGMAGQLDHQDHPSTGQLFTILEEMAMLDGSIRSTTGLLVYDDLAAAQDYIAHVYGLTPGPLERDADGRVIHTEVRAGEQVIWLHPAGEQFQSPRTLGGVSSMTVVAVDDADAHHARGVQAGAANSTSSA